MACCVAHHRECPLALFGHRGGICSMSIVQGTLKMTQLTPDGREARKAISLKSKPCYGRTPGRKFPAIVHPTKSGRAVMRYLIIPLLLVGGFIALTTTQASAVIYCAAGVYRAGCVARPVVVAPAVVVAPRPVVVAPRAVVVAPRRRVY
jgi:hypothetical protein